MSVRLKIILGFVVILVMVSLQSILIITMNNKKDALSSEAQTLYRMNVTLKDQIIDIKTYQTDFLNTIIRKLIVPKETDRQTPTSANIIFAFDEWVDEFIKNPDFQMLDKTRQDLIKEMKPDIKIMKSAVNDLRETDVEKESERMDIYTVRASISAQNIINRSTEFVKLNSLVLSTKNAKLLEYSKTISMAQYILIAVALLLIMFIIFYSQFLLTPLNWLMEGVSHITKGELSYKVKKRYNDELGKLADQFNLMSDEIRNYRDHLELLVKQRTEQLLEAKEELEKSNENLSVTNRSLEEA
ncbi:MAG TPA: HAMP domain-containing protein, partial [Spirochaetota bacterium]|nr:HAMP domain-containing protein [Spirochaetota bacterium]